MKRRRKETLPGGIFFHLDRKRYTSHLLYSTRDEGERERERERMWTGKRKTEENRKSKKAKTD